jgi:hypothetical protein
MIGPIRQELLSGIKEQAQFEKVKNALQAFRDEPLDSSGYKLDSSGYKEDVASFNSPSSLKARLGQTPAVNAMLFSAEPTSSSNLSPSAGASRVSGLPRLRQGSPYSWVEFRRLPRLCARQDHRRASPLQGGGFQKDRHPIRYLTRSRMTSRPRIAVPFLLSSRPRTSARAEGPAVRG